MENNFLPCTVCKNPIMYCLCVCPYCGDDEKTCGCGWNYVDKTITSFPKKSSELNSLVLSKKSLLENHIGKSWWRLEKWQIGRSRYS